MHFVLPWIRADRQVQGRGYIGRHQPHTRIGSPGRYGSHVQRVDFQFGDLREITDQLAQANQHFFKHPHISLGRIAAGDETVDAGFLHHPTL